MFTSGLEVGEWQGSPLLHASIPPPDEYRELLGVAGFDAIEFIEADPVTFVWLAVAARNNDHSELQ